MGLVQFFCIFLISTAVMTATGCSDQDTPRRFAFLAGGSGEPTTENFFVEDLRRFRNLLRQRGWNVSAAVGSRPGLLPGSASASNSALLLGSNRALRRAVKGDQVLLLFHSHGRERESYWGQRSHSVVSEDRNISGSDVGFDLDSLDRPILEARSRGVDVALVDLSCYSGATQALTSPSCTVTLAASKYISLCSGRPDEKLFTSYFLSLPPPKVNIDLESHFLEARRRDRESVNFPQISSRETPAKSEWENLLETVDPLDAFGDVRELRTGVAAYDPAALFKAVDETLARSKSSGRMTASAAGGLASEIRLSVAGLLDLKRSIEKAIPPLARDYDSKEVALQVENRAPISLAVADLHGLIEALQQKSPIPEPSTHAQSRLAEAMFADLNQIEKLHGSKLSAYSKRKNGLDDLAARLEKKGSSLIAKERELYEFASEPYPGSSGCRNFEI